MNTTTQVAAASGADASTDRTLAEIARELPGATAVFRRLRLDYCCGGNQSVRAAAAANGIDVRKLERELAELAPAADESPEEPLALIEYILARFHETHRRELPELITLAHRVEERHAQHPEVPRGLAALLEHIAGSR